MMLNSVKNQNNKPVFILSAFVFLYTILSTCLNVYKFKFTGALFEILCLPVCILIFACPIIALVNWIKEKFSIKSLNFYSLVLSLATALTILFGANIHHK